MDLTGVKRLGGSSMTKIPRHLYETFLVPVHRVAAPHPRRHVRCVELDPPCAGVSSPGGDVFLCSGAFV